MNQIILFANLFLKQDQRSMFGKEWCTNEQSPLTWLDEDDVFLPVPLISWAGNEKISENIEQIREEDSLEPTAEELTQNTQARIFQEKKKNYHVYYRIFNVVFLSGWLGSWTEYLFLFFLVNLDIVR